MVSTILVILFLLQLISFYLVALLFTKLGKLKEVEKKQEQVLAEIDDSFSAYIAEIKDENNRLLQELKNTEKTFVAATTEEKVKKEPVIKETPVFEIPKTFVSKQLAASSYSKAVTPKEKKEPVTMKEKVLYFDEEGKSVEEIAKLLQIGKTEVGLFLKFKGK